MTNYEKIKQMSVEEMAKMLSECTSVCATCIHIHCPMAWGTSCKEYMRQFLESEVEENMLPEVCSCGYRFETDETICPNCGKKVEEDGSK